MYFEKGNFSKIYSELPQTKPGVEWREGMVSGNGEEGYITSGAPYADTFIFQNMWFNYPSGDPRFIPPELPGQLEATRQAVLNMDDQWEILQVLPDGSVRKRQRTFYYSFHPGMQLRLSMNRQKESDYVRWTNYETAETGVHFVDQKGEWTRTAFTSRVDGVSIIRLAKSSTGEKLSITLSIDRISDMAKAYDGDSTLSAMRYRHIANEQEAYLAQVVHYPSYEGSELCRGGYACVAKVIATGGTLHRVQIPCEPEIMRLGPAENPALCIKEADEVIIIVKTARTHEMGTMDEFQQMQAYPLVNTLLQDIHQVMNRYTWNGVPFSYQKALAAHRELHCSEWEKASIRLAEPCSFSNEELIRLQQKQKQEFRPDFLQRIWEQARYAQICCSGTSAPRLYGMWTGEWQPGWRGIYTLDANVNLQVSGINVGNMKYAGLGYLIFVMRNTPDWVLNAKMSYGIDGGLQVSVNSDIDRGMHVEYETACPFEYWNAGGSWCLLPLYEFWQCFGNSKIPVDERMRVDDFFHAMGLPEMRLHQVKEEGFLDFLTDVLLPLLRNQANFWQGLCTPAYYMDTEGTPRYEKEKKKLLPGERYLIIPCYSPENHPLGYSSTLTANAVMDISAARDGLHMAITVEQEVRESGWEERIAAWKKFLDCLPEYQFDETGALREWAMKDYEENNNHRHISHLYPAWPAYETKQNSTLAAAAEQALINRQRCNVDDDTAGHGWMHRALVEARLEHGDQAEQAILAMASAQGYYSSLMTDHDTNRRMGCYCTDTLFATQAVLQEMLVFSYTGIIELLPALPKHLKKGCACGLMARTRAEITLLQWDLSIGTVTAKICSHVEQMITLRLGIPYQNAEIETSDGVCHPKEQTLLLTLHKGQEIMIRFSLLSV